MELSLLQKVLRTIASIAQVPVIILLIVFIGFSLFCIGWITVEGIKERLHLNYHLSRLLDTMRSGSKSITECVENSGLLVRQKAALLELTRHPDFNKDMLLSL